MTRDEILTLHAEAQRLRSVLEQARRNLLANAPKTALGHIEEALSTTTVQAERVKPFQQHLDNIPDESQVYGQDCIGGRCEF